MVTLTAFLIEVRGKKGIFQIAYIYYAFELMIRLPFP